MALWLEGDDVVPSYSLGGGGSGDGGGNDGDGGDGGGDDGDGG